MKIIEPIGATAATHSDTPAFQPELAFVLPGLKQLRLVPPAGTENTGAFLAHQVARSPQDLRAHVQRILLHVRQRNPDETFGALIDLFVVLGAQGQPLRQRMLASAAPILHEDHARILRRTLADTGLGTAHLPRFPVTPASVLTTGARGSAALVERIAPAEPTSGDTVEEARSHLEYGQVEEARALLEQAVLNEPRRRELHRELLEIYRSTRNTAHLIYMWNLLDADNNPAADMWLETATLLRVKLVD